MDNTKGLQVEGDNATGDAASCSKKVRKSPSLEEKIPTSPLKKIFKKDVHDNPESNNEDGEEEDTRESVMKHVQSLMDNLEKKRETDKQMVEEFRTKMHSMVWRLYIFNIVNQDAKFYKCVFYKSYVKICLYLCCFIVK